MSQISVSSRSCIACALSIIIPAIALVGAFLSGSILLLDYVHVLIGAIWIGTDVFLGLLFSSVIRTIDPASKANIGRRIIPMTLFFIPTASIITPLAGYILSVWEGIFTLTTPLFIAIIVIGIIIVAVSFGLIVPYSYSLKKAVESELPDKSLISNRLSMISISALIQLVFQIIIVSLMAYIVVYL